MLLWLGHRPQRVAANLGSDHSVIGDRETGRFAIETDHGIKISRLEDTV